MRLFDVFCRVRRVRAQPNLTDRVTSRTTWIEQAFTLQVHSGGPVVASALLTQHSRSNTLCSGKALLQYPPHRSHAITSHEEGMNNNLFKQVSRCVYDLTWVTQCGTARRAASRRGFDPRFSTPPTPTPEQSSPRFLGSSIPRFSHHAAFPSKIASGRPLRLLRSSFPRPRLRLQSAIGCNRLSAAIGYRRFPVRLMKATSVSATQP